MIELAKLYVLVGMLIIAVGLTDKKACARLRDGSVTMPIMLIVMLFGIATWPWFLYKTLDARLDGN